MTTLILGTGLPAPRDVVDAVYARTDGVPLHVEELLSALGRDRLADSGAVRDAAVPETLEDATLTRIARLSAEAQAVARAGAVLGRSFVSTVLAGIMNLTVECSRRSDPGARRPRRPRSGPRSRAVRLPAPAPARCALSVGPGGRAPSVTTPGRPSSEACWKARRRSTHPSISSGPGCPRKRSGPPSPERRQAMAMSSHREAFELMRTGGRQPARRAARLGSSPDPPALLRCRRERRSQLPGGGHREPCP